MMTAPEPKDDDAIAEAIWNAMRSASEAEQRGDTVEALHILRSTPTGDTMPGVDTTREDGPHLTQPVAPLVLQARRNLLALQMGQWGDSPRHDPDSDTPHGWVTLYESLNPRLPEASPALRYWMDRLRVAIAFDHRAYSKVAAWSHDLFRLCQEYHESELEALGNMAVAMSHLGFKATARILYDQILAEPGLETRLRAAVLIRIGDFLWSVHDQAGAEQRYTEAIEAYADREEAHLFDLHNLIGAYVRRSDCFSKTSRPDEAFADICAAFGLLDASRAKGAYEFARSVDAAISTDLRTLVDYLTRFDLKSTHVRAVATALSCLGNTSVASRLRRGELRAGAPTTIYYTGSRMSAAWKSRIQASARWHAFTDDEVDAILASELPVLMTVMSPTSSQRVGGVTVLAGGGRPPFARTWELHEDRSGADLQALRDLMMPPPGVATAEPGVWTRPWRVETLGKLAHTIFPLDDLADRLDATDHQALRVVPIGSMWRFPFSCLPIGDAPLGSAVPFVLAPGPTPNLPRPRAQQWAGHFDLTLANTVGELRECLNGAGNLHIPFDLFDNLDELASTGDVRSVSLLVFSGHGLLGRSDQRLVLAGGRRCEAADFHGLASGATVVLNACWSGYVFDPYGSDPSQQALEFLAAGAHSVLGTIGPISDRSAGQFLHHCLPALAAGQSLACSYRTAVSKLLEGDPDRPLASWASYVTIGRSTEFGPEIEVHDER